MPYLGIYEKAVFPPSTLADIDQSRLVVPRYTDHTDDFILRSEISRLESQSRLTMDIIHMAI
jgi:hypothetical protein